MGGRLREFPSNGLSRNNTNSKQQRVVILAGPHKTGTTSLRNNIMLWTSSRGNGLSTDNRSRWYAQSDAIDMKIFDRILDTHNNEPALAHFDGSTQFSYQMPNRGWETVYCRREPIPFECDYRGLDINQKVFDFNINETTSNNFEIIEETPGGKTQVRALVDIPTGSYIMPSSLDANFIIRDASVENLKRNIEIVGTGEVTVINNFLGYIDEFGHRSIADGSDLTYVEVGPTYFLPFTNDKEKANVGRWMPNHPDGKRPVYSPVYDRRMHSL